MKEKRFDTEGITCKTCEYLDQFEEYDLYFCPQNDFPTILCVYLDNNDGESTVNYLTGCIDNIIDKKPTDFGGYYKKYIYAVNIAKERGLIN